MEVSSCATSAPHLITMVPASLIAMAPVYKYESDIKLLGPSARDHFLAAALTDGSYFSSCCLD